MTKRRILACVFTCCAPGKAGFTGGESLLGWSLLNQISRYHDVWALTQNADRVAVEESLAEYPSSNIHFEYVDLPFFLRPLLKIQGGHQIYYYLWQLRASFAARKLNKVHRFDLFHHITYANDWMANFIGAWLPVPYVRGPGGGAHRTPKSLLKEYSFSGRIWERLRSMGQWIFRHDPVFIRSQNHASAILLCNQDSINSLSRRWTHKAHLFPVSGVSTEDLAIVKERDNRGPFHVVSAGSLLRIKGFGLAIKSFSEFSSKHPDSRLRIYGSGPEEAQLNELIRQSGNQDKIHLMGSVSRDALLQKMASSDAFLFPSLRDGGGTVVIEAMAVGTPVVCLDIGGPGMHITEECGIKITPTSREETITRLAEGLERLYLDRESGASLGAAAKHKAEQNYHWDKLGDRLNQIYLNTFRPGRDD